MRTGRRSFVLWASVLLAACGHAEAEGGRVSISLGRTPADILAAMAQDPPRTPSEAHRVLGVPVIEDPESSTDSFRVFRSAATPVYQAELRVPIQPSEARGATLIVRFEDHVPFEEAVTRLGARFVELHADGASAEALEQRVYSKPWGSLRLGSTRGEPRRLRAASADRHGDRPSTQ